MTTTAPPAVDVPPPASPTPTADDDHPTPPPVPAHGGTPPPLYYYILPYFLAPLSGVWDCACCAARGVFVRLCLFVAVALRLLRLHCCIIMQVCRSLKVKVKGKGLPPRFARWVDASASFLSLASSSCVTELAVFLPPQFGLVASGCRSSLFGGQPSSLR